MEKGIFSNLAAPGAVIAVRVHPRARKNDVTAGETGLVVRVTAAPESGKANRAVAKLLAHSLGIAKSRLVLVSGATSRHKTFRIDQP